ncbi:hypothetical protein SAMN05444280_11943 [Tangfeifania diversioriginum]|uniref:Uncharacterized protein n=1 Tax=Tangfeifania diversioriginum TaxID=1168035 RepID=A0A1M6J8V9_9BACT|nr:hypothetical protein SAMN05444280_11943 [Tangfeifania diversioriginum]
MFRCYYFIREATFLSFINNKLFSNFKKRAGHKAPPLLDLRPMKNQANFVRTKDYTAFPHQEYHKSSQKRHMQL